MTARLLLCLLALSVLSACSSRRSGGGGGSDDDDSAPDDDDDDFTWDQDDDDDDATSTTDDDDATFVSPYTGGWPVNDDADDINDPGVNGTVDQGDILGRIIGVDQYGDTVDMYDFAGQGRPIVLDVFAEWCPPCMATAEWLGGGQDQYGLEGEFGDVREAVNNGDIYWISVMEQDNQGQPADFAAVQRWHNAYPNKHVPVIANPQMNGLMGHLAQNGFPNFHALNEDMVIVYMNDRNTPNLDFQALSVAMSLVP